MITKIKHLFAITLLIISATSLAQTNEETAEEAPYIEVTGSAEKEIVPDEIYIGITIREKYENKTKVTIEEQEEKLKTAVTSVGVNLANLFVSDANADYVTVKWRTKDVLTKKEYLLKVGDAVKVGKVFQELEKLQIMDAYISKVNHSKLDSLKKEVKIMAIKAAKNKADYLLAAIGEKTGKALVVQERDNTFDSRLLNTYQANYVDYEKSKFSSTTDTDYKIQFQKIKIQSAIYVKFLIK